MQPTCPACQSELTKPDEQRYCSSCGEPINVEVDRDQIRTQTQGILTLGEQLRICKTVKHGGGRLHDYTHVSVQEEVRHALFDLWLLNQWDAFDEREAMLGDLSDHGPAQLSDDDALAETQHIIGLARFLFSSVGLVALQHLIHFHLKAEISDAEDSTFGAVPDIDVSIQVNGTPVDDGITVTDE